MALKRAKSLARLLADLMVILTAATSVMLKEMRLVDLSGEMMALMKALLSV